MKIKIFSSNPKWNMINDKFLKLNVTLKACHVKNGLYIYSVLAKSCASSRGKTRETSVFHLY
tara:strand:- start:12438 stop:12623 length:186 start_codon:yes stop_codon:yes gene_type:complete